MPAPTDETLIPAPVAELETPFEVRLRPLVEPAFRLALAMLDGGRTWSLGGVSPPGSLARTLLDEQHLLVVTETGVQVSADRGATWTSPGSLPGRASRVDFLNPRDGFAGDPGSRSLLVTADGGRTGRSVPT